LPLKTGAARNRLFPAARGVWEKVWAEVKYGFRTRCRKNKKGASSKFNTRCSPLFCFSD